MKEPLLISACLLGTACRYDGASKGLSAQQLQQLQEVYHLIPVCPEQLGGLPTPRVPSERCGSAVITADGRDVTAAYEKGAAEALRLAQLLGCRKALLKERSPSCGSGRIYDGSFSRRLTDGNGVAAQLLAAHGLQVLGETQLEALL